MSRSEESNTYSLARDAYLSGDLPLARTLCQQILHDDPNHVEALHLSGVIAWQMEQYEPAIQLIQRSIALAPNNALYYYNLSVVYRDQGDLPEAYAQCLHAIQEDPQNPKYYYSAANILIKQGKLAEGIDYYKQSITLKPDYAKALFHLTRTLILWSRVDEAVEWCHYGLQQCPDDIDLYLALGEGLADQGKYQEAFQQFEAAQAIDPTDLKARWLAQFSLPILYETVEEIEHCRQRYIQGLTALASDLLLDTDEQRQNARSALGSRAPFYLPYQGYNDRDLQEQYGRLAIRIMSANYPQWSQPRPLPPLQPNERIRVGYISHYLCQNTCGRLFMGWLSSYDSTRFEVYCYHLEPIVDSITQYYQNHCDHFRHLIKSFESTCQQIIADQLHILVFLDIGIHAVSVQLASLRLAPIQCVAWAQPLTTGLSTIDAYLSSELMEPEDGSKHYLEKLVRLPNLSIYYEKPTLPKQIQNRSEFNLADQACVYLSCQSLYKYLPQYDDIYPLIALRIPHAQFAFIADASVHVTQKFERRLDRAFQAYSLHYKDYCVIEPRQSWIGYINLNRVSDIFLDTIGWSGGNTTLEAVAVGLPIVTCPGELMRSRHAFGILKRLNVLDTVATDLNNYVDIAVGLGSDPVYRQSIVERMIQGHDLLYADQEAVQALYQFYQDQVLEQVKREHT